MTDAAPILVWATRPDGFVDYCSRGWCEYTGLTEEQTYGSGWKAALHPDDDKTTVAAVTEAFGRGESYQVEQRLRRRDGEYRWFLTHAAAFRDATGNVVRWHGANLDIQDKKDAEAALRERESRAAFAIESTGVGVLDWDIRTGGMEFSDRWLSMTGYSRQELPPRLESLTGLVHPEDLPLALADVEEVLAGRQTAHRVEHRLKHKAGHWLWVEARSLISAWGDGRVPLRMVGTHLDITERKHRAELEHQLEQAQKMESVGRLAGGVAHDFNNMLSVILGYTELLLGQIDPALPQHASLAEIQGAALRSADFTRQLLAFARKQTVSPTVLELNAAIGRMREMLQRLLGEDVRLVCSPGADLWLIKVDPSQIDQILANLCANARDAITGVGQLSIETGNSTLDEASCAAHPEMKPGEYVRLVVTDDGRGMDEHTLSHLFEPFFTTKAVGLGTGLGLATVYGIVRQNNGFITVEASPGQGSKFTIYLPRHVDGMWRAATGGTIAPVLRGDETILLVEDELGVLNMTKQLLEQLGYAVLVASSPAEAIRLAERHRDRIQLLLTDVVMPEMNGRDLSKTLLSANPTLRSLFMSGHTANVIAEHSVLEDGVHFLQKPFSKHDLAEKVRAALR